ncbi:MAG: CpaF family protein [Chloroflexi bacterium]|nr:MAG: CpaF family protein [Chloroflexota bacterium]
MAENFLRYIPPALRDENILRIKARLISIITPELQKLPSAQLNRQNVRAGLEKIMNAQNLAQGLSSDVRQQIVDSALADLVGYGPLDLLLADGEISEIMVNGPKLSFVERGGELFETDIQFDDDTHLMRIIDRILLPLGRRVDYDNPTADARLPDGSRVNVAIRPVAVDGPVITIRKFLQNRMVIEDLISLNTLTPYMAKFLEACVVARMNILISGNTSSGKSTMLNILSTFIPNHERIITIEDAVELQMKQRHVVRMETKLPGVDGMGAVSVRDLVRNALRMRPDRLIVGEVRGGETLDMLQAMNTGHSGSLTTLHANTPRDAIARLETMALMAGLDLPISALRKQISSALNLIVHMARLPDGTRKATQITEVVGMEGDIVTLTDIYKFTQTSVGPDGKVHGDLKPSGIRPMFSPRLEVAGYKLGGEYFGLGF